MLIDAMYNNLRNVLLQKRVCLTMNPCSSCPKSFDSKRKLYRHVNRTHTQEPLMCSLCNKSFARKDILVRHIRQHHPETDGGSSNSAATFRCNTCSKVFARKDNLLAHIQAKHMDFKSGKFIVHFNNDSLFKIIP